MTDTQFCKQISVLHVHGHDVHPWNCLADNIANATMRDKIVEGQLPDTLVADISYDRGREWEWLFYAPKADAPSLSRYVVDTERSLSRGHIQT